MTATLPHGAVDPATPSGVTDATAPVPPPTRRLLDPWMLAALFALVAAAGGLLGWLLAPHPPADDSAEAGFARDMRRHHAQAVEMAFIILDRSNNELIDGLAVDIIGTQLPQAGQMLGWLDAWNLPATGAESSMAWMGHADQPMPGLASPEQIAALQALTGRDAEVEFLRLMIAHHQGGVSMAEAILDRTDRQEVESLAEKIVESQQGEITYMRDLIAQVQTT